MAKPWLATSSEELIGRASQSAAAACYEINSWFRPVCMRYSHYLFKYGMLKQMQPGDMGSSPSHRRQLGRLRVLGGQADDPAVGIALSVCHHRFVACRQGRLNVVQCPSQAIARTAHEMVLHPDRPWSGVMSRVSTYNAVQLCGATSHRYSRASQRNLFGLRWGPALGQENFIGTFNSSIGHFLTAL